MQFLTLEKLCQNWPSFIKIEFCPEWGHVWSYLHFVELPEHTLRLKGDEKWEEGQGSLAIGWVAIGRRREGEGEEAIEGRRLPLN